MPEPRNRKERRAAAKADPASDIPLKQPDRNARAAKTLLDLAAERRAELMGEDTEKPPSADDIQPEIIHTKINEDGSLSLDEDEVHDESLVVTLGNALLFGISLAMVHLTLDVLVHNQYAERFAWSFIASRAAVAFLVMSLLTFIMHPRADAQWAQLVFLGGSVSAGCYLTYISSTFSYFAVMRQAPPLGVLWIYSVFEQRLEVALMGLVAVGGYFWWGGYSIFS